MKNTQGALWMGLFKSIDTIPEVSSESEEEATELRVFSVFEENAVNPLVSFMNQPMVLDADKQEQKDAGTEDSNNTANGAFDKSTRSEQFPNHVYPEGPSKNTLEGIIAGTFLLNSFERAEECGEEELNQRQFLKKKSKREHRRRKDLQKNRQKRMREEQTRCPHLQTLINSIITYFG